MLQTLLIFSSIFHADIREQHLGLSREFFDNLTNPSICTYPREWSAHAEQ
jgi:hypothetical protein